MSIRNLDVGLRNPSPFYIDLGLFFRGERWQKVCIKQSMYCDLFLFKLLVLSHVAHRGYKLHNDRTVLNSNIYLGWGMLKLRDEILTNNFFLKQLNCSGGGRYLALDAP